MRNDTGDNAGRLSRRRFAMAVGAAVSTVAFPLCGQAAPGPYPARPVRLIVPFPPGGPVDLMGRSVGNILAEALQQPVAVENRAGAGGNIGVDLVAKAPADGYTLGIGAISSLSIAQAMGIPTPYHVDKDLAPICLIGKLVGAIIANPAAPFSNLTEMIAYAKAHPDKLAYASSGLGTSSHLAAEYLASRTGIRWTHVPYKGTAPAVQDLIGGQVPVMFETSLVAAAQHASTGRIKAIAITGASPSPLLPGVATVEAQGVPDFDVSPWVGLVGPSGLPPNIVAALNTALVDGLKTDAVAKRFATFGGVPESSSPDQFRRFIAAETQRWTRVVQQAGIKPG